MKFKVGDKVRQVKSSVFYNQSGEAVGTVEKSQRSDFMYFMYDVQWDNGTRASYDDEHLESAIVDTRNDKINNALMEGVTYEKV